MTKGTIKTQNLTIASLLLVMVNSFCERHGYEKLGLDDVLDGLAMASTVWHTIQPYALRVFNHFFPPAAEPQKEST